MSHQSNPNRQAGISTVAPVKSNSFRGDFIPQMKSFEYYAEPIFHPYPRTSYSGPSPSRPSSSLFGSSGSARRIRARVPAPRFFSALLGSRLRVAVAPTRGSSSPLEGSHHELLVPSDIPVKGRESELIAQGLMCHARALERIRCATHRTLHVCNARLLVTTFETKGCPILGSVSATRRWSRSLTTR
jgi:hypothetical protein